MSRRRLLVGALLLIALAEGVLIVAPMFLHRDTDGSVARLDEITLQVERTAGGAGAWTAARVGDRFLLGSAVRTGAGSRAQLHLTRGGVLKIEANATVRFASKPGQAAEDVRVETGTIEVEAGDETVALGEAILEPHGHARISNVDGALTISVELGRAVLETGEQVLAGNSVTVRIGVAILEPNTRIVDAGVSPDAVLDATAPTATSVVVKVTGKPAVVQTATGPEPLTVGEHTMDFGARIQTAPGGTLEIAGDGARVVATGAADLVIGGADGAIATATKGVLALRAETADGHVVVPGGTVIARTGGAEIAVRIGVPGGTEIEDRQGDAAIKTAKADEALAIGDRAILAPDGAIDFKTRAPAHATISIAAGESPVIHDPRAPTAVGVRFGAGCTGPGIVEVAKDRSFKRVLARAGGTVGGNVLLPTGVYAYRVRCGDKASAGSIRIFPDSGRVPLPKAAPRTLVEADGREYMVLYQNLLPEFTLSWRDAPVRASYQFVIQPATGDAKRLTNTAPRLGLKPGDLREGTYRFWVEIPETGGRSAETRIVIDFDNAAASASIDRVDAKDNKAHVNGTVIEGSTVSSGGSAIDLDQHRRFSADLSRVEGETGISVRIAHPKLGINYYVVSTIKTP